MYTFSSGVNAIQEWYKLHYMNIMAQIDAEQKERMSYSAEELMLSCLFDGDSCDARLALGKGKARAGTWAVPGSPERERGEGMPVSGQLRGKGQLTQGLHWHCQLSLQAELGFRICNEQAPDSLHQLSGRRTPARHVFVTDPVKLSAFQPQLPIWKIRK